MTSHEVNRFDEMKVSELQAKFAQVCGETTRSPNKVYLIRRIHEAIAAAESAVEPEAPASGGNANHVSADTSLPSDQVEVIEGTVDPSPDAAKAAEPESFATPGLSKLDVPALQTLYAEILGKETSSTSRNYLLWKIREARRGRVPLGPRATRRQEDDKVMVLPLRMAAGLVDQLDDALRRLGHRNRMELFRAALGAYFGSVGETEVASSFSTDA